MAGGERGNLFLRILDRALGIPLVRVLGLFRKKGAPPQTLHSVGVLCLGCIGDMVLLSGPLADLAREHPGARLTIFCSRANQEAAQMAAGDALVVALPVKNPLKAAALVRQHGPFDVLLDASQWPRLGALLSVAARARFKIGFKSPEQHRHHAYDAAVAHSRGCHELENFRRLFTPLGITGQAIPRLAPQPGAEASLPGGHMPQRPYAVLHLFPGGYRSQMKEWPLEHWRSLVQKLLERGLSVLLSGGPADRDPTDAFVRSIGSADVVNLSGCSLNSVAVALQHAAVAISVNTGIMHLAAALGTPLVSLQGPTSTARWGAVAPAERHVALHSTLPCAPCLHLGFEYSCEDSACMRGIPVAAVLKAVDSLLDRAAPEVP